MYHTFNLAAKVASCSEPLIDGLRKDENGVTLFCSILHIFVIESAENLNRLTVAV